MQDPKAPGWYAVTVTDPRMEAAFGTRQSFTYFDGQRWPLIPDHETVTHWKEAE